jgi:tetratricopeptide (TPR) repeat protein
MGEDGPAASYFQIGLGLWGALPNSGLQILTALDPLAQIRRDQNNYKEAEEYYTWALRLREAALGPKDLELISTLDSLAYVLFGQRKYAEAEPVYNRLLALWEMVGGQDHPMVALTLDKMAEFFIEQKRYDTAEPLAQRALFIRSKATIEGLHRTGRVLTGQKKLDEATEVYARAVRIATEAGVPDEDIPGTLRAYALLLRQKQRGKEADAIDKRLREAMNRKTEKEGKRPAPPPPSLPRARSRRGDDSLAAREYDISCLHPRESQPRSCGIPRLGSAADST